MPTTTVVPTYIVPDPDLEQYLHDLDTLPIGYSAEEEHALFERIREGDEIAQKKVITANLRLVVQYALKYRFNPLCSPLDLIQEGNLGLMKAVEKYDPYKRNPETGEPYRFTTYATWWIRQAISRAYPEVVRPIRVPVHYWEFMVLVKKKAQHLLSLLGREPTTEEIAREVGPALKNVEDILQRVEDALFRDMPVLSLDAPIEHNEDQQHTLSDTLEDESPSLAETMIEREALREQVERALATLTNKRQKRVIRYIHGLDDAYGESHSLAECGKKMGITRERTRQLREAALETMRLHRDSWE